MKNEFAGIEKEVRVDKAIIEYIEKPNFRREDMLSPVALDGQTRLPTLFEEKQSGWEFDADLEGHINNLTWEQQKLLYEMWDRTLLLDAKLRNCVTDHEIEAIYQQFIKPSTSEASTNRKGKKVMATFSLPFLDKIFSTDDPVLGFSSEPAMRSTKKGGSSSKTTDTLEANTGVDELWLGGLGNFVEADTTILRFLRARKWDINAASQMFFECLYWRWNKRLLALMRQGEALFPASLIYNGKTFFHGVDKSGHLVLFVISRKHDKRVVSDEENENYTIYHMELARRLLGPNMEKCSIVFDLYDAGYNSLDISSIRHMIHCFQSNYPESLHRCYILNAPWLFWAMWKLISPVLDPVVSSKISFIKRTQDLLLYLDEETIPEIIKSPKGTKADLLDEPLPKRNKEKESYWDPALLSHYQNFKTKTKELSVLVKSSNGIDTKIKDLIEQRMLLQQEFKVAASASMLKSFAKNVYEKKGILSHEDPFYLNWEKKLFK